MSWLVFTALLFISGTAVALDTNLTNEMFDDFKVPLEKRHDLLIAARNISREITKKYPFITPNGHIDKLKSMKARKCLGYFATHHIIINSKHKLSSTASKHMKTVYNASCGDTFDTMDMILLRRTANRHLLDVFGWTRAIAETVGGAALVGVGVGSISLGFVLEGVPIALLGTTITSDGINNIINESHKTLRFRALYSIDIDDAISNKREIDTIISRVDSLFA
jgi:hypothetical protein